MKEYFMDLFEYEKWANNEIVNSLQTLSDEPEKAMSIMSHIINAQIRWLSRIKNIPPESEVWQSYSQSEIKDVLKKSSHDLSHFLNSISDSDLERKITYVNTKGDSFVSSLKEILTHLAVHSAYHRGQIIILIKPVVKTLPYTDYIYFARNIRQTEK
jgi:uncharacterized damage-inducible protein DinB